MKIRHNVVCGRGIKCDDKGQAWPKALFLKDTLWKRNSWWLCKLLQTKPGSAHQVKVGYGMKDGRRQLQTDVRGGWEADVKSGKAPSGSWSLLCEQWEAPERCSLFLQRELRPLGRKTSLTLTVSPVRELSRENFASHDTDVGYVQNFSTMKTAHSHCQDPAWDPCSEARKKGESREAGVGCGGGGCWQAILSSGQISCALFTVGKGHQPGGLPRPS